jgi:hypothetical protein
MTWGNFVCISQFPRPAQPSSFAMTPRKVTGKARGQNGVASPFLWGAFIPYNVPVYPGAFCPPLPCLSPLPHETEVLIETLAS